MENILKFIQQILEFCQIINCRNEPNKQLSFNNVTIAMYGYFAI